MTSCSKMKLSYFVVLVVGGKQCELRQTSTSTSRPGDARDLQDATATTAEGWVTRTQIPERRVSSFRARSERKVLKRTEEKLKTEREF